MHSRGGAPAACSPAAVPSMEIATLPASRPKASPERATAPRSLPCAARPACRSRRRAAASERAARSDRPPSPSASTPARASSRRRFIILTKPLALPARRASGSRTHGVRRASSRSSRPRRCSVSAHRWCSRPSSRAMRHVPVVSSLVMVPSSRRVSEEEVGPRGRDRARRRSAAPRRRRWSRRDGAWRRREALLSAPASSDARPVAEGTPPGSRRRPAPVKVPELRRDGAAFRPVRR